MQVNTCLCESVFLHSDPSSVEEACAFTCMHSTTLSANTNKSKSKSKWTLFFKGAG